MARARRPALGHHGVPQVAAARLGCQAQHDAIPCSSPEQDPALRKPLGTSLVRRMTTSTSSPPSSADARGRLLPDARAVGELVGSPLPAPSAPLAAASGRRSGWCAAAAGGSAGAGTARKTYLRAACAAGLGRSMPSSRAPGPRGCACVLRCAQMPSGSASPAHRPHTGPGSCGGARRGACSARRPQAGMRRPCCTGRLHHMQTQTCRRGPGAHSSSRSGELLAGARRTRSPSLSARGSFFSTRSPLMAVPAGNSRDAPLRLAAAGTAGTPEMVT